VTDERIGSSVANRVDQGGPTGLQGVFGRGTQISLGIVLGFRQILRRKMKNLGINPQNKKSGGNHPHKIRISILIHHNQVDGD